MKLWKEILIQYALIIGISICGCPVNGETDISEKLDKLATSGAGGCWWMCLHISYLALHKLQIHRKPPLSE